MRTLRSSATLSAVTVAALLLAGCGSGEDAGTSAEASASAEPETPLTAYLSSVWGGDLSPEEQEAQMNEQQQQAEELTATCMQEEGFEYAPNTQAVSFSAGDGLEWEPDDRAWVTQYGYGVVHSPGMDQEPAAESEYVDPNGDYLASLSESEQQAFSEALYGAPMTEEMSEGEMVEYDWASAGCSGRAQHEVAGADPSQDEQFQPLFDAMNELWESTASSPAMVALDGEWATCMDAAGHPGFAAQAEAQESMYTAVNKIYEDSAADMGEFDGTEAPPTEDPNQPALDALAEEEVALALADLDCRESTDYRERQTESQRQAEEQFIADHKTELDALVAASEQE
jgi:hypothetical protein